MTYPPDPGLRAARHRMVDELLHRGVLHAAWQDAFRTVRREDLHRALGAHLPPVTPTHRLADTIYHPDNAVPMTAGTPTEPVVAPAPAFVARLLSALRPADGDTALVVGATDGYLPALLCARLGAPAVTVTDASPTLLDAAGSALRDAGYQPTMHHVDAYNIDIQPMSTAPTRIVSAQPRERIPLPWIRCAAPGGLIVAAVSQRAHGGPAVALDITADGTAHGRFLPGDAPDLPAGPHEGQPTEQFGLSVTGARLGQTHGKHYLWWRTPDTVIVDY